MSLPEWARPDLDPSSPELVEHLATVTGYSPADVAKVLGIPWPPSVDEGLDSGSDAELLGDAGGHDHRVERGSVD